MKLLFYIVESYIRVYWFKIRKIFGYTFDKSVIPNGKECFNYENIVVITKSNRRFDYMKPCPYHISLRDGFCGCIYEGFIGKNPNLYNLEKICSVKYNSYCYSNCEYLSITEEEQDKQKDKSPHICNKYKKRVLHDGKHPNIMRLNECNHNQ